MSNEEILNKELEELQSALRNRDLQSRPQRIPGLLEILIFSKPELEFRIEPDHHKEAHFHLTIGKKPHAASIRIKDPKVIAGSVPNKYLDSVLDWTTKNEQHLLRIWDGLKKGGDGARFIKRLADN